MLEPMSKKGFTLIELLVVVTILAILSLAGIAAFRNTAGNARDAKRKADVDAIAKAYETKFDPNTSLYPILDPNGTDFTNGVIPTLPEGGDYTVLLTTPSNAFRICAALESTPVIRTGAYCWIHSKDSGCYCRGSSQGQ